MSDTDAASFRWGRTDTPGGPEASSEADVRAHAATLWDFHARGDSVEAMAAIVCLGSYDLRVAHRSADLALAHLGARIVVSGAYGNWTRGVFPATEAEIFAKVMTERGVPSARIALEPRATNIGENIAFARDMLQSVAGEVVVFVTKPQTQGRVRATAPMHWPSIRARVTAPLLRMEDYETEDAGLGPLIEEMVGDLDRMIAYPALGFQVPVDVPASVLYAFEALKAAGYTKHCLGTSTRGDPGGLPALRQS